MQALHILGLSLACMTLYLSGVQAECGSFQNTKLKGCIKIYEGVLANEDVRESRLANNNTACPTDIIEKECTEYKVMDVCMDVGGFPDDCSAEINAELLKEKVACTYDELKAICAGSAVMYSISVLVVSLLAAAFRQL